MRRGVEKARNGFTLAEAMVATVVLGIAAAGVLLPFVAGASVRAEGQRMTLAAKLGADLMEEILCTPFDEIVATYNGYTETEGQVKDATGAIFTDPTYAAYSRDVTCDQVYVAQESGDLQPVFIRATVRVYYKGRPMAKVGRLISR